jgi:exodeoxyribonuclease VII large subunit
MHESATPPSRPAERVLSVTELTRTIKRLLEGELGEVWVEGELSNVKVHGSGHVYFSLKDEGAVLPGIMFRGSAAKLRFAPLDGQKVRVLGKITVYEPQGKYQISATSMEPVGIGELELAFRQLYERLEKEGLFDAAKKRPIPRHPRVIGIVTSETGAAIRDLLSVIGRRAPHVHIVVRPARVQGVGSAEDVARAIADFDDWGEAEVLIVGRGGGSIEDLWAFNEEIVARAIRGSRVPVISAVGHEIDFTIADFAADLRAPTPSAAAELVTPDRETTLREIERLGARLARGIVLHLRRMKDQAMLLSRSAAFRRPLDLYARLSQEVDGLVERLAAGTRMAMERARLRLASGSGRLDALSPLAVLDRGYALALTDEGAAIRSARDVRVGAHIRVRLAEGSLRALTEEVFGPEEAAGEDPWARKDSGTR